MICRRGTLQDLKNLKIADELAVTPEGIEFNIVGMGHEFWIAIEDEEIVGLTALARTNPCQFTIMYLRIAESHMNRGVGSALLQSVVAHFPSVEFVVVPFAGTEDFYERLGFRHTDKFEMRRQPTRPE